MPVGSNGRWYNDPVEQVAADLGPTYVAAAGTTTYAFKTEGYDTIRATLQTHEFLATAMTGANNDIVVMSRQSGTSPSWTLTLADPAANNASLSVSKSGNNITVNLATNGSGTITSTASQVVAALNSDDDSAPYVYAIVKTGDTGEGVVTALAQTALTSWTGTTPTLDVSLETSVDGTNFNSVGTAFGQKTNASADEGRAFSGLGADSRWKAVVGGTTPAVVFSINAQGNE